MLKNFQSLEMGGCFSCLRKTNDPDEGVDEDFGDPHGKGKREKILLDSFRENSFGPPRMKIIYAHLLDLFGRNARRLRGAKAKSGSKRPVGLE